MSEFSSADHIETDNSLAISVKVFKDNDDYLSTFFLSIPDRDVEIEEFKSLILGITTAKYKMEQLLEIFDNGFDT